MIENYVGPQLFQQGVHNYLAAHLYANATAEDFWNAQTSASHLPVDKVMSSFVVNPGVPLLTFSNERGKQLPVAERRFFLDEPEANAGKKPEAAAWVVPVCIKTSGEPMCSLVSTAAPELRLPVGATLPFLYANAAEKGYYRVAYTPEQTKAITANAETGLTVPERIGYLGDRWALTRAGQASVGDFLDLALALKQDPNANVLETVLSTIAQIRNRIANDAERDQLNALIRAQFGPVYTALGPQTENESYEKESIRSKLYAALGDAGDPAVLAHARQVADDLFNGRKVTDENIMQSIALAAEQGNDDFYNRIQTVSQKADDPEFQ
jgi:aminopeptidase N/puromycin-sensitive aminopeptidase